MEMDAAAVGLINATGLQLNVAGVQFGMIWIDAQHRYVAALEAVLKYYDDDG